MSITLHTATPSDADDIASLLRASWTSTYGSFLTLGLSFWMKRGFRICGRDKARIGDLAIALVSMERAVAE